LFFASLRASSVQDASTPSSRRQGGVNFDKALNFWTI